GHKALAVNLSDIAAMGAEPFWALVSLLLPPELDIELLDGIYRGMRALARRYNVAIVGGNIAMTPGPLTIDVTLLGRLARGAALTRAGGQAGDALLVTGTLGMAAAGLLACTMPADAGSAPLFVSSDALAQVRRALVAPEPRITEGRVLAAAGGVTALLDVSDGLAADLRHLCDASSVGAVVEADQLPIAAETRAICTAYGRDPLQLALTGGEDYELLGAVRPKSVERALSAVHAAGGTARVIGRLTDAKRGISLQERDGTVHPLPCTGWDHLRSAPYPPSVDPAAG